jgi:Uncharacterized enzyme of phosphonate metabolism
MNAVPNSHAGNAYNFGFLDEYAKKEVRRAILKAIAIPGYQVPYASREMPMGRGFGTGGLQLTLSLIGPDDVVKVIDQGSDDSVNAVNLRRFIEMTCPGVSTTTKTAEATLIQSRHRIPELPLTSNQIIVLQVPYPDPLVVVEPSEDKRKTMHGEADYSFLLVKLFQDLVKFDEITISHRYPTRINGPLRHRSLADSALGRAQAQRLGGPDPFRRWPGKEDLRRAAAHQGGAAGFQRRAVPCRGLPRRAGKTARLRPLRLCELLPR